MTENKNNKLALSIKEVIFYMLLLLGLFTIMFSTPVIVKSVMKGGPVTQSFMLKYKYIFGYIIEPLFGTFIFVWFISKRKKISIKNLAGKSAYKRYNLKIYFPILIFAIARTIISNYINVYQFNTSGAEPEVNILVYLIGVTVLSPITEEIIYRGIILRGLLSKHKPWLAIVVSAIFFSISHLAPSVVEITFISGIIYGVIYYKSRSLLLTTVLHSIANFIAVLDFYNIIQYQIEWWFSILGAALTILGFYLFIKFIKDCTEVKNAELYK